MILELSSVRISTDSLLSAKVDSLEKVITTLSNQMATVTPQAIVQQSHDFYSNSFFMLLGLVGLVGIGLPILVTYFQKKRLKLKEASILEEAKNILESKKNEIITELEELALKEGQKVKKYTDASSMILRSERIVFDMPEFSLQWRLSAIREFIDINEYSIANDQLILAHFGYSERKKEMESDEVWPQFLKELASELRPRILNNIIHFKENLVKIMTMLDEFESVKP